MKYITKKRFFAASLAALFVSHICISTILPVQAQIDFNAEAEARKSLAIQSNDYENWPDGPAVGAQSAILMEANTGTILYSKNIDEKLFPASTTKILTALIAVEKCSLDEPVEFSEEAVNSIDWRSDANMGIKAGNTITMEQALNGVLVGSANEAAYAVAEHISGSIEEFAKLMNAKAKELGCKDSNFVTPNGIHDANHYTSVYDLATIARAFFKNELLCKISSTYEYQVPMTATQPNDMMIVHSKNKLLPNKTYGYEYLVGSKTGYTGEARQTLVTCARKDGMTLICVIMKEESPNQYVDTLDLFDYGFSNFKAFPVASEETNYSIDNSDFFDTSKDVFGNSEPILSLNATDYIVLPNTSVFTDAVSSLSYDTNTDKSVAKINYTYHGIPVGSATVDVTFNEADSFTFEEVPALEVPPKEDASDSTVFINIKKVIFWIVGIAGVFIFIIVIRATFNNYNFSTRSRSSRSKKRKRDKRNKKLRDIFTRYYD